MDKLAPYAKAIVAFLVPGVLAIQTAMQEQSPGGSAVTLNEWIGAGLLCISTAGLVWAVPNGSKTLHAPAPVVPVVPAGTQDPAND